MIRIVIAEDQELLLEAIGSLLNLEDDMEVVGRAGNGEEALTLVHQLQPDVCIMDIEMPKLSGLEAAEALMPSGCKVIILTTFEKTGSFQRALKADVRGYLLKDSSSEELSSSIRSIMNGKRIYSRELIEEEDIDTGWKMENVERFADGRITNNPFTMRRNTIRTVRNYFSTIIKKIKLRTG